MNFPISGVTYAGLAGDQQIQFANIGVDAFFARFRDVHRNGRNNRTLKALDMTPTKMWIRDG